MATTQEAFVHAALAALLLALAQPACAGLTVGVVTHDGKPLEGAVITVEPEAPGFAPAAATSAVVDQVNLAFVPHVSVIPVHSTVQFPNSDAVSHQVYSFSPARKFQLPLYRGEPYPPVRFDLPGVITLGCNIHDDMLAYIVVTEAPHFGLTDAAGEWSSPDLPSGRYRVRAWHPSMQEPRDPELLVDATGDMRVEMRLTRATRPAPLDRKPRSWSY